MSVAENASGVAESLGLLPSTENHQGADRRTLFNTYPGVKLQN
jgi:hypothetical protein